MESSEDDAGGATNASRRASAREKDIGAREDGSRSVTAPPEPAEATMASETTSMSEFDGDSVPSPSQDNTSTEAILDMIDEIVEGPAALRRRSHYSEEQTNENISSEHSEQPTSKQDPIGSDAPSQPPTSPSASSAKSETMTQESSIETQVENPSHSVTLAASASTEGNNTQNSKDNTQNITVDNQPECINISTKAESALQQSSSETQEECTSNYQQPVSVVVMEPIILNSSSEALPGDGCENLPQTSIDVTPVDCTSQNTGHTELSQASSSGTVNEAAESTLPEASTSMCLKPEAPSDCASSNIPSSSVLETVQSALDTNDSEVCGRTIKCAASSESRDNVTVESAESTSNDSCVSETRTITVESSTRSPLRRRLVRPTACDRRPDSTVSSTVDTQVLNVHTTEQTPSDCIAKDVSSSSDTVPHVHDNDKPEEIRSVSEISVCKAETSVNSPKKIKLVRQKIAPPLVHDDETEESKLPSDSDLCQSTSTDNVTQSLSKPASDNNSSINAPECASSEVPNECTLNTVLSSTSAVCAEQVTEGPQVSERRPHESSISRPSTPVTENKDNENDQKRVPPIKLNLNVMNTESSETKSDTPDGQGESTSKDDICQNASESTKQVPKLTIKLGNKQQEDAKSPIPKLTIKPIRPPPEIETKKDPIEAIPSITKLNIKPIPKPAEKLNDIHRKSSSSEISESESSENDESNSTSDQTSASDQGSSEVVPKVTIKLGKPGTESEGKFYTEPNVPKLTIKGLQHNVYEEKESVSKLNIAIAQPEEKQAEKVPKLTIKTITKTEGQPLSPKLTIKPLKPPDSLSKDSGHIPKLTIKPILKTDESTSKTPKKSTGLCDSQEHIPVVTKLNIKPIVKPVESETTEGSDEKLPIVSKLHIKPVIKPTDSDEIAADSIENKVPAISKLNIKPLVKPPESSDISTVESSIPVVSRLNIKPIMKSADVGETVEDVGDNIPVVSKLNIKPLVKPAESETTEDVEEIVPVVSKLNIKPVVKPKDNVVEDSVDDIPKITKLNIKPLKEPEVKSSAAKDCDVLNAEVEESSSIPLVMKLNIKPIVKPLDEDTSKDSENQSSETGNSSDDNADHIPVVTKLNIKPIVKPDELEVTRSSTLNEENVPVVTKINIKPLIRPEESKSPVSPKKDGLKITKLNIKPVVKPDDTDQERTKSDNDDATFKNPPLLMKINMKAVADIPSNDCLSSSDKKVNSITDTYNNLDENLPKVTKLNIKPITKPLEVENSSQPETFMVNCNPGSSHSQAMISEILKQNCTEIKEVSNPVQQFKVSKQENLEKQVTLLKQNTLIVKSADEHISNKLVHSYEDNQYTKFMNIKTSAETDLVQATNRQQSSLQNCTLLKKLLETKKDGLDKRLQETKVNVNHSLSPPTRVEISLLKGMRHDATRSSFGNETTRESNQDTINDFGTSTTLKTVAVSDFHKDKNESITKPLEINISDKMTNLSSGQDSPRIILKINKTDHGPSAKIITEEPKRPETPQQDAPDNTQEVPNDKPIQKKNLVNSRKKPVSDTPNESMGKRLRSSRIVENTEKTITPRKNPGKRPSATEISPTQTKEPELSVLETKRLKLGQILSNKSFTPVPPNEPLLSPARPVVDMRPGEKTVVHHALLNNENCSKNGNSKLHNILSNLQAKQAQALAFNDINCTEKKPSIPELDSNTSTGSSDVIEIIPIENSHPEVQQMIINENSESRDFTVISNDVSQDPLEVDASKISTEQIRESPDIPKLEQLTPQPKKRGRPRKLPVSEGAKPAPGVLPVPALEERPQRSLRLSRYVPSN